MKVLIYADLSDSSRAGGAQTYLAALIKALGELTDTDDQHLILGPPPAEAHWLKRVLGPNQTLVRHAPGRQRVMPRALGFAGRLLRRALHRALHSPTRRGVFLRVLRRSAATAGVPVSNGYYESLGADVIHFPFQLFVSTRLPSVFNPHDLQHLHLPHFFHPAAFAERELKYYHACHAATRIAVATRWVADDVAALYRVPPARLAVVPWGAATAALPEPYATGVAEARERYAQGEPFVFYPAVAWPHKNHDRLIAAMALLRSRGERLRLVLSGGATSLLGVLHESCRRHGASGFVNIAGHIPDADLRALYRAARAVVVPTLFEAASGPVAEAWLEGTPVACSDIPPLRSQADGAALFFDPLSPDAIADAIARIVRDEPLRRELVTAGARRIAQQTWRETALGYRALYREAAAARA